MSDFFSSEGPFLGFLEKVGQIIIINVLCIICMLPVITMLPSLSAFYYAMIKSVRRGRGYAAKEFFRSFKHTFVKGILFSVIYIAVFGFLFADVFILNESRMTYLFVYVLLAVVLLMIFVYLIPVLGRFDMKSADLIKLSFIMSLKHFPTTVVLTVVPLLLGYVLLKYVTVVAVIFVPGVWCYFSTYLIERIMKKYMPKVSGENEDAWYLE